MADRPLLMSPAMVRATLREIEAPRTGKRQTRRVVTGIGNGRASRMASSAVCRFPPTGDFKVPTCIFRWHSGARQDVRLPCAPGDRLWVREAWKTDRYFDDLAPSEMGGEEPLIWIADNAVERWGFKPDALSRWGRHRQGMHMPRWASRLTLTVTDVRVERVQDISVDDCLAEGVKSDARRVGAINRLGASAQENEAMTRRTARWVFEELWNSLNAARGYGWDVNPWIVAITFKPELRNIDQRGPK